MNELRTRARDSLEAMENEPAQLEVSQDLETVSGITQELIEKLKANQIASRDDLAELAVDELVDMTQLDEQSAKDLIMTARAHWFN